MAVFRHSGIAAGVALLVLVHCSDRNDFALPRLLPGVGGSSIPGAGGDAQGGAGGGTAGTNPGGSGGESGTSAGSSGSGESGAEQSGAEPDAGDSVPDGLGGGESDGSAAGSSGAAGSGPCPAPPAPPNAIVVARYDDLPASIPDESACTTGFAARASTDRRCRKPVANALGQCRGIFCDASDDAGICLSYELDPSLTLGCTGGALVLEGFIPRSPNVVFAGHSESLGGDGPCGAYNPMNLLVSNATHLTFWAAKPDDTADIEVALESLGPAVGGLQTGPEKLLLSELDVCAEQSQEGIQWRKYCVLLDRLLATQLEVQSPDYEWQAGPFDCVDASRLTEVNFTFVTRATRNFDAVSKVYIDDVGFEQLDLPHRSSCLPRPLGVMVADYDDLPAEPGPEDACLRGQLATSQCLQSQPNSLGQCAAQPLCDADAPEGQGGGTCIRYVRDQEALRGRGGAMQIDFDIGRGPYVVEGAQVFPFAGVSEKLVSNDAARCEPLAPHYDLESQGAGFATQQGQLTFWVRRSSDAVQMEVSIKSENAPGDEVETTVKPRISEYLGSDACGRWTDGQHEWFKVCIPLNELTNEGEARTVDLARLWEINFRFIPEATAARTGTLWLDEVAFELFP